MHAGFEDLLDEQSEKSDGGIEEIFVLMRDCDRIREVCELCERINAMSKYYGRVKDILDRSRGYRDPVIRAAPSCVGIS